jgi:hypothetical protein
MIGENPGIGVVFRAVITLRALIAHLQKASSDERLGIMVCQLRRERRFVTTAMG